jgi:catechol 2,3-dioxygenase-like lactoylglutathione lyase family enzyme
MAHGNPTITTVNIGAREPNRLADFYQQLLGYHRLADEPGWVLLRAPNGNVGLSFQYEQYHQAPVWPPGPGDPQMQMHLEIRVDDLDAGVARALELGARLADYQPQDEVRVCLDPAGHPFCLWLATG